MVKFGLICYQEGLTFSEIKKIATEAERAGFDSLWFHDHYLPNWTDKPLTPIFEVLTLLSALSIETSKIRLGTLVLCNSYRPPSLLAKMTATLDIISGGRLEFGIGVGWNKSEHTQYGYPFPKPSERINQLDESLYIIRKMWTEKEATFDGKYFSVANAICEPKPIQKPHPPIWVGGKGNLILKVVAKHANGCNFTNLSPGLYEERLKILQKHCTSLGRDYDSIVKSFFASLVFGKYKRQMARQILGEFKSLRGMTDAVRYPRSTYSALSSRMYRDPSYTIEGTPEECIEKIRTYVDLGVTYFMLKFPFIQNLKNLETFAERILPEFK